MRKVLILLASFGLSACVAATPAVVTPARSEVTVREVDGDLVLRSALVSVGTQMSDAMAVGPGMPVTGAYARVDTIRVGGVIGRTEALAVVESFCRVNGRQPPAGLAQAVVRLDRTTGEYVVPLRCAG
jgi:hypothetical protein